MATPAGNEPIRTGANVSLVFRPERGVITDPSSTMTNLWQCTMVSAQYMGAHTVCTVEHRGQVIRLALLHDLPEG